MKKINYVQFSLFILVIAFIAVFLAGCSDDDNNADDHGKRDTMAQSQIYMQWFYENNSGELWDHFSDSMKQVFNGSLQQFADYQEDVLRESGVETEIIDERMLFFEPNAAYERASLYEKAGKLAFYWFMDSSNLILQLEIRPLPGEAPTSYLYYETITALRLPFEGEWVTVWGGRNTFDNYHAEATDQRFAYDFMVVKNGIYFDGNGSRNEDFFCFGQPISAPADGIVVALENDVTDNIPGEVNSEQPLGNYMIIDHGNDEFSFMVHFKKGSVTVSVGQSITTGQQVGECGNSGFSDLPHLHYHLQNTPVPFSGEGLPAYFNSYFANETFVDRGEPIRGEKVQTIKR